MDVTTLYPTNFREWFMVIFLITFFIAGTIIFIRGMLAISELERKERNRKQSEKLVGNDTKKG